MCSDRKRQLNLNIDTILRPSKEIITSTHGPKTAYYAGVVTFEILFVALHWKTFNRGAYKKMKHIFQF